VLTMIAWYSAAQIFAYYLSTFANYAATYAGLASIMIALVFLYMSGVILMLGAEVNAALMKYRVRTIIKRSLGQDVSVETESPADG
jgi:membrane protein